MGQTNSLPILDHYADNYELVNYINSPPYGNGKILKHKSNSTKVFQMSLESFDRQQLLRETNQIAEKLNKLEHSFILKLVNWCEEDTSFILGKYGKISLFYEYCPYNLEKLIMHHQQTQIHFSEQEIVYLLYALVNIGNWLRRNNTAHKNILPKNILLTEEYSIKVAPVGCFPFDSDALHNRNNFSQYCYLPPETDFTWYFFFLSYLRRTQCDVFASGLTLLDAMSLIFSYDIVEIKCQNLIEDRLISLRNYYSRELIMIVRKMLKEKSERIDFDQLFLYLHPLRTQIMNFEKVQLPLLESIQHHRSRYSQPPILTMPSYYFSPSRRTVVSPVIQIQKPRVISQQSCLQAPFVRPFFQAPQILVANQTQLDFLNEQIFKILEQKQNEIKQERTSSENQENAGIQSQSIFVQDILKSKLVKIQESKIRFFTSPKGSSASTSQSICNSPNG